ncbi:hypothetical protein [Halostella sp. PRR32]|uniref:hypothetical protein n=1 Tax=Halostella sp. PRR32 TaxID=3098147 RepID=UPI002B1E5B28|nr:hypothetical protein [Halostella sp. PRR32]
MPPLNRREALQIGGIALGTAVAGCLGSADDESDPTDTTNRSNQDRKLLDYEVVQFSGSDGTPNWYDDSTTARSLVIDSEKRARAAFGYDASDKVQNAVEGTDFDSSVLLSVTVAAPTACYHVELDDLSLDDDRLVGSVSAVDDDGHEDDMCVQTVSFPAVLVRAQFDGTPVSRATLSVTDGWDDETELEVSASDSLSPAPSELPGHVRPDGDPANIPPELSCEDDAFERHPSWFDDSDVSWGEATGNDGEPSFALRVDETTVERGDTIDVTLTNVTDEEQTTGNRHKYSLQVRTEAGWEDVRGSTSAEHFGYTDEAILHPPGEGFNWTIEMTENGLVEDHPFDLEVCPDLPAGRYRFVHWGPTVAVAFDVE